jgi:hypothetical protein
MSINFKTLTFAKANLPQAGYKDTINADMDGLQSDVSLMPKLIAIKEAIEQHSPARAVAAIEAIENINQILEISEEELAGNPHRKYDIYNTNILVKLDKIKSDTAAYQGGLFTEVTDILANYRATVQEFKAATEDKMAAMNREHCETLLDKALPKGLAVGYRDFTNRRMFTSSATAYILSTLQHSGTHPHLRPFDFDDFVNGLPRCATLDIAEGDKAVYMQPIRTFSNLGAAGWSGTALATACSDFHFELCLDYCDKTDRWMNSVRPKIETNGSLVDKTPAFVSLKNIVNSFVHDEKVVMSMLYNLFN